MPRPLILLHAVLFIVCGVAVIAYDLHRLGFVGHTSLAAAMLCAVGALAAIIVTFPKED